MDLIPTSSQTVGPFFHVCLTAAGNCIPVMAGPEVEGERVRLVCRLFDGENAPVDDAMIEVWQADSRGRYHHPDDWQDQDSTCKFRGFGRMGTDENGACQFQTIKPGRVPGPDSLQSPHLNLAIFARGMLKQLYTRAYFAGELSNTEDPILALVPKDRRKTLMAKPDLDNNGTWRFEIHLQGKYETVFFDV